MTQDSQNKTTRPYDIVVFGSTGFTGNLTAKYLAGVQTKSPFKLAIAGRDPQKLTACQQNLLKDHPGAQIDTLIADSNDYKSLVEMASQSRVVITTVGPYLKYGKPLAQACVETGCNYVDLTGEPEFVEELQHDLHEAARENKVKIINCCGFDSIPHDLGALFTVQKMNELLGADRAAKAPIQVQGYIEAKGNFSGGTWHSAVNQLGRLREFYKKRKEWNSDQTAQPNDRRRIKIMGPRLYWMNPFQSWACPFPTIDPQVVKRTASARQEYGPDFTYGHYILMRTLPAVMIGIAGAGSVVALSQFKYSRNKLLKIRDPGQGPSESEREKSWFKVHFVGEADGLHVWTEVSGGDPGYGETAKMLAESALCLALDKALPEEYGVVTPGAGMGNALIDRLNSAGIKFRAL